MLKTKNKKNKNTNREKEEKQHTFRANAERLLVTLHLKLSCRSRLMSGFKFPRWGIIVRSGATFWNSVQVMPLKLLALITCASTAMLWEFCGGKCRSVHVRTEEKTHKLEFTSYVHDNAVEQTLTANTR